MSMDKLTERFKQHHAEKFQEHGATAKGVDWNDEQEMFFRYGKILKVLDRDFDRPSSPPTLLDVGCGWGGLLQYSMDQQIDLRYTGIDVVQEMVDHARERFPEGQFIHGDVFNLTGQSAYDYVVCNAIMTQKLEFSIPEMDSFCRRLIRKMFDLSRFGVSFNLMSTQVNFMVDNLFYKNPLEMLQFCFQEITPRVRLDHGYSSLRTGKGKFYDYTVYLYKD